MSGERFTEAELRAFAEQFAPLIDLFLRRLRSAHVAVGGRDLGGEIAEYLVEQPPSTGTEIADAIGARRVSVVQVLETDARFVRCSPPPERSRRSITWVLALQVEGQVGTSASGRVEGSV